MLSQRLKEVGAHRVIESRLYAEHPPRRVYSLTEKGQELRPVLLAMKLWLERYTDTRSITVAPRGRRR